MLEQITATFSNLLILHADPAKEMEQSVPKRRHIKLRYRRITQKRAYNIQNRMIHPDPPRKLSANL